LGLVTAKLVNASIPPSSQVVLPAILPPAGRDAQPNNMRPGGLDGMLGRVAR
jgi:hypothetical protein